MRPINNVVDATNYVMFELNQPMHAYDLAELKGPEVVARRAWAGEKLVTLDGVERSADHRHDRRSRIAARRRRESPGSWARRTSR